MDMPDSRPRTKSKEPWVDLMSLPPIPICTIDNHACSLEPPADNKKWPMEWGKPVYDEDQIKNTALRVQGTSPANPRVGASEETDNELSCFGLSPSEVNAALALEDTSTVRTACKSTTRTITNMDQSQPQVPDQHRLLTKTFVILGAEVGGSDFTATAALGHTGSKPPHRRAHGQDLLDSIKTMK